MKFSIKAAALVTTFLAAFSSNADVISTYDIDFATADLEAHQQNSSSTYDVYTNGVLNLRENAWVTLNLFDTFGISELDLDNGATSYNFTFDIRVLPGVRNPNPNPFTEIAGRQLPPEACGTQRITGCEPGLLAAARRNHHSAHMDAKRVPLTVQAVCERTNGRAHGSLSAG